MNIDYDALENVMKYDFYCDEVNGVEAQRQCMETVRKSYAAWNGIKSFADLMRVSRDAALGKIYSPFYAELLSDPNAEDNRDMHAWTNVFAELQTLGFVTVNSQFEEFKHDNIDVTTNRPYTSIQKAYIVGFMPEDMAVYVCGVLNRRADMVAWLRRVHFDPPKEFRVEKTHFGVTFEGDNVEPYTRMNLQATPQDDLEEWCPQINRIIMENRLVYVTLINVNYNAPLGTLLNTTVDVIKRYHGVRSNIK